VNTVNDVSKGRATLFAGTLSTAVGAEGDGLRRIDSGGRSQAVHVIAGAADGREIRRLARHKPASKDPTSMVGKAGMYHVDRCRALPFFAKGARFRARDR